MYNIFIYKQVYGEKKRANNGGNKTKTRWLTCPNCYDLIMQVWVGPETDEQKLRLTVLERYYTKSLHRKRILCKKGHRVTR